MLMRVVAVMLLLSAGIAAAAMSYSFVSKASGRLGGPIRFEFYHDSTTRPKTDIESFTVSMRTADDRWKAMWSILGDSGLTQPIEYGVTPPGFTTMIQPQKLVSVCQNSEETRLSLRSRRDPSSLSFNRPYRLTKLLTP